AEGTALDALDAEVDVMKQAQASASAISSAPTKNSATDGSSPSPDATVPDSAGGSSPRADENSSALSASPQQSVGPAISDESEGVDSPQERAEAPQQPELAPQSPPVPEIETDPEPPAAPTYPAPAPYYSPPAPPVRSAAVFRNSSSTSV
ncbi:MAG: hypothetical protein WBG92_18685, partial [Thiohalocapsa sp.]